MAPFDQVSERCRAALTEIEGQLGVVVSLSVRDEVDLVLPPLLLEALLGAPVLTDTAARQDNDQSPYQPEPCREPTAHNTLNTHPHKCCKRQRIKGVFIQLSKYELEH